MTKIVINKRYGGFGLSPKATIEYFKRKGIDVYRYTQTIEEIHKEIFHKCDLSEHAYCDHYSTIDKPTITSKEINDNYISERDIERDDPDLITIVEEMGETSFGDCATLEVIEIPDNVEWEISEYDGWETIHEKHRVWE